MFEMGAKKMLLDSIFAENDVNSSLISSKKYQKINKSRTFLPIIEIRKKDLFELKYNSFWRVRDENPKSMLFSRGRRTEFFYTEDSKLYITPKEQKLKDQGIEINGREACFDSLSSKIVNDYRKFRSKENDFLYRKFLNKYAELRGGFSELPQNFVRKLSLVKLWNFSLVVAVIIGMVSMTFIYRYLGAGASAEENSKVITSAPASVEQVLGVEEIKNEEKTVKYIEDVISELENSKKDEFDKKVEKMVKGYPIEKMLPYLLEKDKTVVAFYIGIAKKESNWGKRVPVLDGKDCYNYLGYRGKRKLMGTGGHTCFNSRKDAVDTISKRIEFLIEERKLDTPEKMSIWKCGSACSKDGQVHKWISDVSLYYDKLN